METDKTVFISYRRDDRWPALAVFRDLARHEYDVFIDYDGINSGEFEHAIIDNIRARAHFLVVLTKTALERCADADDWLRREIEVAIESKRNIVPLLFDSFSFQDPAVLEQMKGSLALLGRYQAVNIPADFFDAAMDRLRSRFLFAPADTVIHPAPDYARTMASTQRASALAAIARESSPTTVSTKAAKSTAFKAVAAGIALIVVAAALYLSNLSNKEQVQPDPNNAMNAAEQFTLARKYYFEGAQVFSPRAKRKQDMAEALKWYRKSAEQGDPQAQTMLGILHQAEPSEFIPISRDDIEGFNWMRKAAEQGWPPGQTNLGNMYLNGKGVEKNAPEALAWYTKAADQDFGPAMRDIGRLYAKGAVGVKRSQTEAAKWFRKASDIDPDLIYEDDRALMERIEKSQKGAPAAGR